MNINTEVFCATCDAPLIIDMPCSCQEPTLIQIEQTQNTDTNPPPELMTILTSINWQKFHELCLLIGNDLNEPQYRFLKAIFLENAVAQYSNNQLSYVGNEEHGCDFIVKSLNNLKIEMKYTTEALFSGKQLLLRKKTKQITLLNSKGTNTHTNLPDHYSDYLLIVEMKGAAIISKEKLKKYVSMNGDSLSAIIPTEELHIIFTPNDLVFTETKKIDIKQQILTLINKIITSI